MRERWREGGKDGRNEGEVERMLERWRESGRGGEFQGQSWRDSGRLL